MKRLIILALALVAVARAQVQTIPPPPAGGTPVTSVFGRTGIIASSSGDYTAAQVTNAAATNASNTFTAGTQDFSGVAHTLPFLKGTTAGKPATCTQGEMYFATDATAGQNLFECSATNVWTQQLLGSGAAWSALSNPSANLSVAMGADTSTFTWNAATGAAVNLFNFTDTLNNTGTGALFNINTASGSAATPAQITANGNGLKVDTTGTLQKVGTGGIAGAALPATAVQTNQNNTYTTGTQNFSGAAHTLPVLTGTIAGKPATCTTGEEYFATDALAGRNTFYCTATNTWAQEIGLPPGWRSVTEFGAVGDGVTNNSTAIQNAINYFTGTTNGGTLYFPPGNYAVATGLTYTTCTPTVNFVGAGGNTYNEGTPYPGSTIIGTSASMTVLTVGPSTGLCQSGPTIDHLNFVGNSTSTGLVVQLTNRTNVIFSTFRGFQYGYRLRALTNDASWARIDQVNFVGGVNGFDSPDNEGGFMMTGGSFVGNSGTDINITGAQARVIGVKFDGGNPCINILGHGAVVVGNQFENCTNAVNIMHTGGVAQWAGDDNHVIGNHFRSPGTGNNGIFLENSNCTDNKLLGNTFESFGAADSELVDNGYRTVVDPPMRFFHVIKIANGTNGCASANGCWQINANTVVAATTATAQTLTLMSMAPQSYVSSARMALETVFSGTTTATVDMGTDTTGNYFFSAFNAMQAWADGARVDDMLHRGNTGWNNAHTLTITINTTGSGVNAIVAGSELGVWADVEPLSLSY